MLQVILLLLLLIIIQCCSSRKRYPHGLDLFIVITSASHHHNLRDALRSTYLNHCNVHQSNCSYLFFIDVLSTGASVELRQESHRNNDIVYRDCSTIMLQRHPNANVTYGNSPPIASNIDPLISPDYPMRIYYKLDWKISQIVYSYKYIFDNVSYFALLEDDMYVCIDNLLHQLKILKTVVHIKPFAIGTNMQFGGFDDSSIIMSHDIAYLFASNYLTNEKFRCFDSSSGRSSNSSSSTTSISFHHLEDNVYLSFGNSWSSLACNWRKILSTLDVPINIPSSNCYGALFNYNSTFKYNGIYYNPYDSINAANTNSSTVLHAPCNNIYSLIYHNHNAMHYINTDNNNKNICKSSLILDKIKKPSMILKLHRLSSNVSERMYLNYSHVFTNDNSIGWKIMINEYISMKEVLTQ